MTGIIDTVGARSGNVGSDVYPAGHIVQITALNTGNTDTTLSTGHSWDPTVVTGSITPLFDDSSIIINAQFSAYAANSGQASGNSNPGFTFRWLKTSSASVTANPAGVTIGTNNSSCPQGYLAIDDSGNLQSYNIRWPYAHVLMDSDCETTSAITYTLQCASYNTASASKCGAGNTGAWWHVYFMEIKR